jgi:hypothetical protein
MGLAVQNFKVKVFFSPRVSIIAEEPQDTKVPFLVLYCFVPIL